MTLPLPNHARGRRPVGSAIAGCLRLGRHGAVDHRQGRTCCYAYFRGSTLGRSDDHPLEDERGAALDLGKAFNAWAVGFVPMKSARMLVAHSLPSAHLALMWSCQRESCPVPPWPGAPLDGGLTRRATGWLPSFRRPRHGTATRRTTGGLHRELVDLTVLGNAPAGQTAPARTTDSKRRRRGLPATLWVNVRKVVQRPTSRNGDSQTSLGSFAEGKPRRLLTACTNMNDNITRRAASLTSADAQAAARYGNESNVKLDLSQLIDGWIGDP